MTKDRLIKQLDASVRQRLMNKARDQGEGFDLVLLRYALERLLYRLCQSPHRNQFVLKGAMLFQIWSGLVHRPTRDLDLLGKGVPLLPDYERVFRDVCQQPVEEDGLEFRAATVKAERMKEDEEYEGIRIKLEARLGAARIPIQIDIGFGDAITPGPSEITYPTLLEFPAPQIKAYPRETVVAEKYQAMVMLGIANSRMKDFYDVWTLARQFEFAGRMLQQAIKATFDKRATDLPQSPPLALTAEFTQDQQKRTQWNAFLRKGKLDAQGLSLGDVTGVISDFILPPTTAILQGQTFDRVWSTAGVWTAA